MKVRCSEWSSGVCSAIAQAHQTVVYCPRSRAENCGPGQCCHHPLYAVRPRLLEMKQAGVKLRRYGSRLKDPAFVARLYQAFLKARARRR